jgi:hypothetical protein
MTNYKDTEYDEDYYSDESSIDEYYYSEEEIEYEYDNNTDNIFDDKDILITEWKQLSIAGTKIYVSNQGYVKLSDSIFNCTKGVHIEGTPYRMVVINSVNNTPMKYYVHELVWVAFNDDIPDGWFIGHINRNNNVYDNNINNLQMYREQNIVQFRKYLF